MSAQFDPTQPYSEVFGQPGLAFVQGGKTFNGRGELVTDFRSLKPVDEVEVEVVEDENDLPRCYFPVEEKVVVKSDFDDMHWKQLKVLLQTYGEEYTDRDSALRFLKNK